MCTGRDVLKVFGIVLSLILIPIPIMNFGLHIHFPIPASVS